MVSSKRCKNFLSQQGVISHDAVKDKNSIIDKFLYIAWHAQDPSLVEPINYFITNTPHPIRDRKFLSEACYAVFLTMFLAKNLPFGLINYIPHLSKLNNFFVPRPFNSTNISPLLVWKHIVMQHRKLIDYYFRDILKSAPVLQVVQNLTRVPKTFPNQ